MRATLPILVATGLCVFSNAQSLTQTTGKAVTSEDIQKAIDEFNRLKNESKKKADMVTDVSDNAASRPEAITAPLPVSEPKSSPVLVKGKPKKDPEPELSDSLPLVSTDLDVRVESIRKGSVKLDPSQVKIRGRFPAKPLSGTPNGWLLEKSSDVPSIFREIEIQPGTLITLEIFPTVIVPDANRETVFAVDEPGFNALDGHHQKQTVSAILARSVFQLGEDGKQLGAALDQLGQILSSFPSPEQSPEEPPNP